MEATKLLRMGLLLALVAGAMALIGYLYRTGPQAKELVWDEENPVHWAFTPLTVDTELYPEALEHAVELWNMQIGCDVFELSIDNPVIIIKEGSIHVGEETQDWAAGAYIGKDNTRAEIHLWQPLLVGTDLVVIHHELGHVLGLAHDSIRTMKPLTKENLGARQGMVL